MYYTIKIFHPLRFLSILFLCSIGGGLYAAEPYEEEKEEYTILLDCARGFCLGAAIGDSIGSYCEFSKVVVEEKELDKAMAMQEKESVWNSGAAHQNNAPGTMVYGQVTDDTELAISLAHRLCNMKEDTFDPQMISQ